MSKSIAALRIVEAVFCCLLIIATDVSFVDLVLTCVDEYVLLLYTAQTVQSQRFGDCFLSLSD